MYRSPRGRVRLARAALRQNALSLLLWTAAVALMTIATITGIEPMRAWAVLLALSATCCICLTMTRHIITRLTQIFGYFHDDITRDSSDAARTLRRIK